RFLLGPGQHAARGSALAAEQDRALTAVQKDTGAELVGRCPASILTTMGGGSCVGCGFGGEDVRAQGLETCGSHLQPADVVLDQATGVLGARPDQVALDRVGEVIQPIRVRSVGPAKPSERVQADPRSHEIAYAFARLDRVDEVLLGAMVVTASRLHPTAG